MKNLKRIFPLTLLTLLILTACSSPASNEPTGVNPPSVGEGQEKPATVNAPGALGPVSRYGTNLKCDALKDPTTQKACEVQLNEIIGNMLESEIVSSFDAGRCNELPGEIGKSCQTRLTEAGVQGPITDEERTTFNDIMRGSLNLDSTNPPDSVNSGNPVQPTYDSARCAELKTAGYKEYCEKQVAKRVEEGKLNEIIRSKDKNRCDELTTESVKNDCKRFFGIEVPADAVPDLQAPDSQVSAPEASPAE